MSLMIFLKQIFTGFQTFSIKQMARQKEEISHNVQQINIPSRYLKFTTNHQLKFIYCKQIVKRKCARWH